IFQQAADGTVFLEDVGDLPLELQERLVRVLEDGELSRVGSDRAEKVHVRLIATTGASLEPAVKEGTFSKKLAGLLGERLVELPPLRERREDVIPLVMRHVAQYGPTGAVREITDDALAYLSSYDWPGNLIELRDAVRTACAHAEDGVILPESLPQTVRDACEDLAQREVIPQARRTDGAGTRGTHTV
ncbi:MAG: sigma-54-dependent Fis family transcriptional regulator, partial [Myxococcales bacterium]|nr:sigma-54-dependent Fis family transcriptional regulator [Myxococcales bacterium]